MKRLITAFAALAIALSALAPPLVAQQATVTANSTAFPLSSNILFPARASGRLKLECYNATTNAAVTITFASGFSFVIQPGGYYSSVAPSNLRGRVTDGIITATGTAAQTIACEDNYLQ